jgi:uncharacterized protein DUF3300
MRSWPFTGVLCLALAAGLAAGAQEATGPLPRPAAEPAAAVDYQDALLGDDELDELVGPIALYPDTLLTQVLVAATYPLDVVKADRFLDENTELSDKERTDKVQLEDWDPSVQVLAGGFPTVLQRMADEVDWTEDLGDAMLAQPDDLLDAVQRMRARAEAVGNLESNEAQTVSTEGDTISIAPAEPDVVYVPTYDSAAFTTPVTAPVVVDPDYYTGTDLLTTGVIAFGAAMLVDEIFDDDDDWDDYWDGDSIDWDEDNIFPRGDVDIERGDINRNIDIGEVNIDRSRDKVRIGDSDRAQTDRGGAWRPDPQQRQQAQERIAARERPGGATGATEARLKARRPDSGGQAQLQAAVARREAAGKPPVIQSALSPQAGGKPRTEAATNRGARSIENSKLPATAKSRAAASAKAGSVKRAKSASVQRPKTAKPAVRKAPQHSSAFQRSSSGSRAQAASRRGGHSAGGRGGGSRGGGRGRR